MSGSFFYSLITVLLFLIFIGSAMTFIFGILRLFRSPHRSKLFFSYSHKDSEFAENIIKRLSSYRFRIWIDLGIKIPTEKLEEELSKAVKECEIFLLLASGNSEDSNWVQFEIEQAKKMPDLPEFKNSESNARFNKRQTGRFRDVVVLSLDDSGSLVYEKIKESQEELLKEFSLGIEDVDWEEELSDLPPVLYWSVALLARNSDKIAPPNSALRRIVKPSISLYDLGNNFESAIRQLTTHLSNSTQRIRRQSTAVTLLRIILFLIIGFFMLSSGLLLLARM